MGCSGSQEVPVQKRPTHAAAANNNNNCGFHPIPDRYETIGNACACLVKRKVTYFLNC